MSFLFCQSHMQPLRLPKINCNIHFIVTQLAINVHCRRILQQNKWNYAILRLHQQRLLLVILVPIPSSSNLIGVYSHKLINPNLNIMEVQARADLHSINIRPPIVDKPSQSSYMFKNNPFISKFFFLHYDIEVQSSLFPKRLGGNKKLVIILISFLCQSAIVLGFSCLIGRLLWKSNYFTKYCFVIDREKVKMEL